MHRYTDEPTEADEQDLRQDICAMQTCNIAVNSPLLVSYVYGTVVSVTQLHITRERHLPDHISCNSQSASYSCYAACYYTSSERSFSDSKHTSTTRQTQRTSSATSSSWHTMHSGGSAGQTGEKVSSSRNSLVTVFELNEIRYKCQCYCAHH